MKCKPPRTRFHEGPHKGRDLPEFRLRTARVDGFRMIESSYPSDYYLCKHSHDYACFYIVLDGSLTECYGRKSRECGPMSMVFSPSDEAHSNLFHRVGGRCFLLEIAPERLDLLHQHLLKLNDSAQFHGGPLAWLAIRAYRETCHMDEVSPLVIESLATEIMAEISRSRKHPERRPPVWLERAREFLHANFATNLTLSDVAQAVDIHPVHLARVFRKFYCCTTGEYVRSLRVDFASRELSSSENSLVTIACSAGFSDQSHFSRTFKQQTGISPSEFRATVRARLPHSKDV